MLSGAGDRDPGPEEGDREGGQKNCNEEHVQSPSRSLAHLPSDDGAGIMVRCGPLGSRASNEGSRRFHNHGEGHL